MSRLIYLIVLVALALSPIGAVFVWAAESGHDLVVAQAATEEHADGAAAAGSSPGPIVWMPPASGAPVERVGGAVRGSSALPTPRALVPAQAALTVKAAPSLFWHLDAGAPDDVQLFFAIIEDDGELPLAEVELDLPGSAGIKRVRLADFGVSLEEGKSYEWSISLVPDMNRRAKDVVTMGSIQRVAVPAGSRMPGDARGYAARGLWYDAFEALSDAVDAAPNDSGVRQQRRSLLQQAGISIGAE